MIASCDEPTRGTDRAAGQRGMGVGPARIAAILLVSAFVSACASLGASGPSRSAVEKSAGGAHDSADIRIVELDDHAARRVAALGRSRSFAETFGEGVASQTVIGPGDTVEVSIWEAPPAVLFGTEAAGQGRGAYGTISRNTVLPAQMVSDDGTITIPFAGPVRAAGRTASQVEQDIRTRLSGKAHDPQALVRLVGNEARAVTVLGEVAGSRRVPLSTRGERLLDVVAAVGGPRQPVGKTTIQLSRGAVTGSMPLETIVRDPRQNVRLRAEDIVTVLFEPFSFIALGAVNKSAEVPFEGGGLSLAQALGRIGGLRDERADIRGVFIFRLEDPQALDPAVAVGARQTAEGRVPVIYRLNLADAAGFFAAQDFSVRDKDVIYVSTAPAADLPKFLNTVSSVAFTTIGIANLVK